MTIFISLNLNDPSLRKIGSKKVVKKTTLVFNEEKNFGISSVNRNLIKKQIFDENS